MTHETAPEVGDEMAVERTKLGQPPVQAATSRDRGIGPFPRMILRGATVIDGTGAPPIGPCDITVENGRITRIKKIGGTRANPKNATPAEPGDHEIDCWGKWVTPGFIDCHAHAGVA